MRILREIYMDLIYMGSRKGLLSILGAWGSWERAEREEGGKEEKGTENNKCPIKMERKKERGREKGRGTRRWRERDSS